MQVPSSKPDRFATLDGMRGIAAVMVLFFHAAGHPPIPSEGGYLAVDLFFGLSGFVIAYAYEDRLRSGLGLASFIRSRIIRLYPMYCAGFLITAVLGLANVPALLMIPNPLSNVLYPANGPMWTLLIELLVNIAFAVFALRIGWTGIAAILAISAAIIVDASLAPVSGLNKGSFWVEMPVGIARCLFAFTLGVAMMRLRSQRPSSPSSKTWKVLALYVSLIVVFVIDPDDRGFWDLACVLVILPGMLWLGTNWNAPCPRLSKAMGDISYPLYCIHVPIIGWALHQELNIPLVCTVLVAMAWLLDRFVDRPVRAALTTLSKRPLASPAHAVIS